jgi:hypothetical protein
MSGARCCRIVKRPTNAEGNARNYTLPQQEKFHDQSSEDGHRRATRFSRGRGNERRTGKENLGKLSSAAGEATNLLKKGYATAFKGAQPRSLISEAAQAADGAANFSERIRASLPRSPTNAHRGPSHANWAAKFPPKEVGTPRLLRASAMSYHRFQRHDRRTLCSPVHLCL